MKRFILWFLALLAMVVLVVPLSLYLTLRSEAGSRALLTWAQSFSPVTLTFSDTQGNLLQGMIFSDFELTLDSTRVNASNLDIAWQPQKLWVGSLSLQHVDIQNLVIQTTEQNDSGNRSWPEINLPLELWVDSLRIDGMILDGSELFQQFEFSGGIAGSSLSLENLSLQRQTEQLAVRGQVELRRPYPLSLQLDWQYQLQNQNWEGAADLSGDLERLEATHQLTSPYQIQSSLIVRQQLPEVPSELSLDQISFQGEHHAMELNLRNILGEVGLISNLALVTNGSMEAVDLDVQGQVDLPWAGTSQISAVAHYQPELLAIERLGVDTQRGQLTALGAYDLEAQSINLSEVRLVDIRLTEDISALQAELELGVDLAEGLAVEADIREASLEQESQLFIASGLIQYQADQLTTPGLTLTNETNRASVRGQLFPLLNIRWQLDGPDLGGVVEAFSSVERARLALSGTGAVTGEFAAPEFDAELLGQDMELDNLALESLQIDVAHDGTQHFIEMRVPTLDYGSRTISDMILAGNVEGRTFDMQTSLAMDSMEVEASASGSKDDYWHLELAQLDLAAPQPIGDWSMQTELIVDQTASGWSASPVCLLSADSAGLCLEARVQGNTPAAIEVELTNLPLGFLDYLVVAPLRIDGRLNGNLRAEGVGSDIELQANFRSESGSFLVLGQERAPDPVTYRELNIAAQMQDQLLTANAGVELGESGRISAQGQLSFVSEEPEIDAELNLDIDRLQWLEGVITQIDSVRGDLVLNLNVQGALQNPSVSAVGELREGGFIVPQAGIELSGLDFVAQAAGDSRIEVSAKATSGEGQIDLQGFVNAETLDQLAAQFSLRGERFQLFDRPDLRLTINPDLQIDFSPELLDIRGGLDIDQAIAKVRTLPEGGISPSEDEVIVGDDSANARSLQTSLDLRIGLGSQVEFEGFGLATGLTGELEIEQNPGEPQRSFGAIELVQGEYSAYGRTLSVQRGRMIFQGEFDNPALDVDAEQSYPDYMVGIHLGGTVQEPTTTLYSNPVMSQSDVLAVLLTGQKLDTMSASEAPTLLDAATRLGIVGGSSIAERIEESFGLSEFGVRNDNQNGQSIVAGTYVLPRLYVEWAQGLFEASSAVQLEYRISSQLRLKARSGTSQSMDLIYEIETD